MANVTEPFEIPPLPEYSLRPQPPVVPWMPDKYFTLVLPILAYWTLSMIFHLIDVYDLFPQYRLHTPIELLKRNHVTRWEVLRDVVLQHIIQTVFGIVLAEFDPEPLCGKEDYDVAVWAQRLRLAQRAMPSLLAFVGVDPTELAKNIAGSYPTVAGALAGGRYPWLMQTIMVGGHRMIVPAFASWELFVAKAIYFYVVPALQFFMAVLFVDSWQYWLHRIMHQNKWLYATFHSRHHRLYVPYAYGALYNHPFEGFLLDTLGTGIAYLVSGMSVRQSMWFFTCSSIKTVDDHCGYGLPFDPLQIITSNNAAYHDIHHQSWGIKTNFSQPFFTFWDRLTGTMWKGGDIKLRYERSRQAAERKYYQELPDSASTTVTEEVGEETEKMNALKKKHNKKNPAQNGSLKGLRNRVNGSLQGKGGNVLGVEPTH